MNRAPVALFALLCTLASSMVAAGVASDRPATAGNPMLRIEKSELKTISYAAASQDEWLTKPNWQAIDVQRAVALPTKKIPTRIPEKVKPVAAIIITFEQPQAAVTAPAKPAAAKTVAAKPVAAKPVAAKQNVAIPAAAEKFFAGKTATKIQSQQAETGAAAVIAVVSKMVAASKTAQIQPRVSSSFSPTYVPTTNIRSLLPNNRISLADLHLYTPAVATTTGKVTMLPVGQVTTTKNKNATVAVGGEKLQIAYGSLSMISVGGKSFTASPYIADDAASILLNKGISPTSTIRNAKVEKSGNDFSIWTWGAVRLNTLVGTISRYGNHLTNRLNQAAVGYVGQLQTLSRAHWFATLSSNRETPIKSAQLKSTATPSVKK